ncbi:MAG: arylsulfatase A-like enzyme, partial [Verrucomicrobiales bacterium]
MRVFLFLLYFAVTSLSSAADKPNVVWILSEDNSKHFLRLYDPSGAPTPHIEAMAREGLMFNHAFSNAPVCSVARTTLITGCYGPRIGTQFHRRAKMAPMPEGVKMFPAYLREAGYHTTNNSKTDYNATPGKEVWDESSNKAHWRNRRDGQPFFHQRTLGISHESSLHFSKEKMLEEKTSTDPASVTLAPYHPDTPTFRYTYARYHDRIRDIDAEVGSVLGELKEAGLLEDTFVFYFGDHGGVLPRGKGYAYESGLHVPLVVRIPEKWKGLIDHERGDRVNGFVSFIDFGPTLLNLAGVGVPQGMDGKPFLGSGVAAADLAKRDESFGYADRFDEKCDLVRTLRKGPYKYMRSYWPFTIDGLQNDYRYRMLAYQEWRALYQAGKLDETQSQFFRHRFAEALYDLRSDPHETANLAGSTNHAEILADMRKRLTDRVKGMPDLSFYPESHLVEAAMDDPVAFGQSHKDE